MPENNNQTLNELNNFSPLDEEIDLSIFFKVLSKNKKLISIATASFFSIGCIYGLLQKKVWQGEFQIVISSKDNPSSPNIPKLPFLNVKNNNPLLTEVEILKSPSVLFPIYESYLKRFNYDKKTLPYKKWKKENLMVYIIPGTNILEIKYSDFNRKEIKPTLKKISNIYKEYSPKQKIEILNYRISYLEEQIRIYEDKYNKSFEKAIKFSLENGLQTSFDSDLYAKSIGENDFVLTNRIEILISELENIENGAELIAFSKANAITNEFIATISNQLQDLNTQIKLKENIFTFDDISIKNLKKDKLSLTKILKSELNSYLIYSKDSAKLRIKTANISKDILIENKKNIKEAKKLESILLGFQTDLINTKFQFKEKTIPWKLITDPIVENKPIKPSKRKIAILWSLIGFLTSTAYVLYKHIKKDLVISENEIKNLLGVPLIDKIKLSNNIDDINTFEILQNGILSKFPDVNVSLISLGNFSQKDSIRLKEIVFKEENKRFQIKSKLGDINSQDLLIFAISTNNLYRKDLQDIKNIIELNRFSVFGFILILD